MFTLVYPCLLMFTLVYPCLPMFTLVYPCLLMFTQVCYFYYIDSFASIYIAMCTCLPEKIYYELLVLHTVTEFSFAITITIASYCYYLAEQNETQRALFSMLTTNILAIHKIHKLTNAYIARYYKIKSVIFAEFRLND